MKIALTSMGSELKAEMDPRFGRCKYFIIYDTETQNWQAFENPYINAIGGAGMQASQLVISHDVSAVISGSFGPNAYNVLNSNGIKMYIGKPGTVKENIDAFLNGQLQEFQATIPSTAGNFWMGQPYPYYPKSPQEELEILKRERKNLKRELEEIEKRIKELEGQIKA